MNTGFLNKAWEEQQALLPPLHPTLQRWCIKGWEDFRNLGIPGVKDEEWRYTPVGPLFDNGFLLNPAAVDPEPLSKSWEHMRLPGDDPANVLVFLNGRYVESYSKIRSRSLKVCSLEAALQGPHQSFVETYFGQSHRYQKDGIHALNTALLTLGVLVTVEPSNEMAEPLYIYHISDGRSHPAFGQPRVLVYLQPQSRMQIVESFGTLGSQESLCNHIVEIFLEKDAHLEYYKVQEDLSISNILSTTHIHHLGKSHSHSVVVTLDGHLVRNHLNIVFDAPHCESHLLGLYCTQGRTLADNHTVVDNAKPGCLSNELYKGILDGESTGVFNGKIFVQKDAQKTNAYQSNKNILVSASASVNAKPQLEIFADDVKCSHGCTVGSLDPEALFYLQARGISEANAKALLLEAFAKDILEAITIPSLRSHLEERLALRLKTGIS